MATAIAPRIRRPADPRSDPRFLKVEGKLKSDALRLKQHPPARKKAAEAQAAAKGPPNEKMAGAKAKQVDKMADAPTGKPEETSFLTLLRAEIDKALPKNNSEAKDFIDENQKQEITGGVRGNIKDQKDSASKGVQTATGEPPNQAGVPVKEVTAIPGEPPSPVPQVDAPGAMPAPKPDSDISLEQSKKSADDEMAENQVTPTQLKKANDPRFSAVLDAKSDVQKQADAGPKQYRAAERGVITSTAAKAMADARTGSATMSTVKKVAGGKVAARQSAAKLRDEKARLDFTNKIEGIYRKAKEDVEKKLSSLETDVMRDFDAGIDAALSNMKSSAQREIDDFYDDRYSGALGWTDWIGDKFKDTPKEVKDIIKRARGRFTEAMDRLVVRIANTVDTRLKEAKELISQTQADVKTEVKNLDPGLKEFGKQAEQEMSGRFDEMRQGVEDRKNALAQKLADKYKEASAKADEAAKKMEEENAGLFKKFAQFLGEIVRIIREFKNKLMAVLRKAASLIMDILADPIGFLGNLLSAIKKGISDFVSNIATHLAKAFAEWLFGALASAGIEIPSDLTLPSILKLVLSVLGLTYERMRAKAVKLIGERNVEILEKIYDYLKTLITQGPAALWEKIKEDLSNLKEMVIAGIQNWVIETIIKRAVVKLVSFFNPAGAFIQACIAIYDTVMFLIEHANQILDFVEAVINSVSMIVAGNIGAAAKWIENSLGKMLVLLISFLARLIGLGGIGDKIKEIIHKVQSFVDKAIDKLIDKVVAIVKKLGGAVKAGAKRLLNWWKKKVAVNFDSEHHTLTFSGEKSSAKLALLSDPQKPSVFLGNAADKKGVKATEKNAPVKTAETQEKAIDETQQTLKKFDQTEDAAVSGKMANQADQAADKLDGQLTKLAAHIVDTLSKWGVKEGITKAFKIDRGSFTVEQKRSIAARQQEIAKKQNLPDLLKRNKDGERINVKKGFARRHVVSSSDMATHLGSVLADRKWSEAKLLLEQRGSIAEARVGVKEPLSQAAIEDAARLRYSRFFGYARNLFVGDSKENSSIQQHLDAGHPEMAGKALEDNVRRIKRSWAVDDSIKISRLEEVA